MDIDKELQDGFRKIGKRPVDTFVAHVKSVDTSKATCVVSDGELDYGDVRLSAVINTQGNKVIVFPAVESSVLVSPINEDLKKLYVEAYSEIDGIDINVAVSYTHLTLPTIA